MESKAYVKNNIKLFTISLFFAIFLNASMGQAKNLEHSVIIFSKNQEKVGSQRKIEFEILQQNYCIAVDEEDIAILEKIVEAEAGGEDEKGKLLVANVVINRVKSSQFPNTIKDVVYQKDSGIIQFSPVADGRIDAVSVQESTKKIVEEALQGKDVSQGALYFVGQGAQKDKLEWFYQHLQRLFIHGGHEFFI